MNGEFLVAELRGGSPLVADGTYVQCDTVAEAVRTQAEWESIGIAAAVFQMVRTWPLRKSTEPGSA